VGRDGRGGRGGEGDSQSRLILFNRFLGILVFRGFKMLRKLAPSSPYILASPEDDITLAVDIIYNIRKITDDGGVA